eukprot:COSAG01_NODE_27538_length_683_cov_0.940068_2_plen_20_part_01
MPQRRFAVADDAVFIEHYCT